ncbi:MAG: hypothetical protein WC584_01270 [Candidatus Pacearchaeota archaeon]
MIKEDEKNRKFFTSQTQEEFKMIKNLEFLKQKKFWIIGIIFLILIAFFVLKNNFKKEDFVINTNTILLKLSVSFGGSSETTVKITNLNEEQTFKVHLVNFQNVAFLEEESFKLVEGESKEIKISFKDTKSEAKIYSGQLVINSLKSEKRIPIILSVEDKNSQFAIITETIQNYEDVYPGGKLGVKVKIYNVENNDLHNTHVSYIIKSLNDEIILSEEENLVIKGNIEVNKIIDIPKDIPNGNYIFITYLDSNGTKTSAGHLFSVSEKKGEFSVSNNFNFFVIVILFFLVGILILFFYFIKTRDDLLVHFRRQQNKELKGNLVAIQKSRLNIKNLKDNSKRKKEMEDLDKIKRELIRNFQSKRKNQDREVRELKKKGKKEDIERRLRSWEKENLFETEQLKQKLKVRMGVLKKAYSEKHISKESYKKGRKRIKSAYENLK